MNIPFSEGFVYLIIISVFFMGISLLINIFIHGLPARKTANSLLFQFISLDIMVLYILLYQIDYLQYKWLFSWQVPAIILILILASFINRPEAKLFSLTQNRIIVSLMMVYAALFAHTGIYPSVLNFLYVLAYIICQLAVFGFIQSAFNSARARVNENIRQRENNSYEDIKRDNSANNTEMEYSVSKITAEGGKTKTESSYTVSKINQNNNEN